MATTTYPAIQGKFGSTKYYVVTMPASELNRKLILPREIDEWEKFSLEEKFQREINFKRVREHIAPYLANDPDRFFGAFIVAIQNHKGVKFVPLSEDVKTIPKRIKNELSDLGILYIPGEVLFVPLDGQHRLAAIKFALTGKDEKEKAIRNVGKSKKIGNDICTCIMIKFQKNKARKIFNKVNRYAKPTRKADKLITADDDIIAVIARKIANDIFQSHIVNSKTDTLGASAVEFTTLSTIYDSTKIVLQSLLGSNQTISTTELPEEAKQRTLHSDAEDFWKKLLKEVKVFSVPLKDKTEAGDEKRIAFRKEYVLGKPIVQLALVQAIVRLAEPEVEGGNPKLGKVYKNINECDWRITNPVWDRIIMSGGVVVSGDTSRNLIIRFLEYYLGGNLSRDNKQTLTEQYRKLFDKKNKRLPPPIK